MTKNILRGLLHSTLLIVLWSCQPKEEPQQNWYKGNLHTHSLWSDGDEYPEMIIDWYKTNGYDFVALSDHNILADTEKWILVPKSKMYEEGFENYLGRFGDQWVNYKTDSGRTQVKLKTYLEYKYLFEDENFIIIQSEEITDSFEGKPIHMNATNIQSLIPPQHGTSVTDVMQRNVDAVLKQKAETGAPMFPHINHPNFHYAISLQNMIDLHGERFFEVYNGHPQVHNYGDSAHISIEKMWDLINIAYLKKGQPLMYALATDDSHNYHQFGAAYSNAGRGWVMVQADSLTPGSLIRAMEEGKFYASNGVILDEVRMDNNHLYVKVQSVEGVNYRIEFIGAGKNDQDARILKTFSGTEGDFELSGDIQFVRAKITSDKIKSNPFQEGEYEMAWTQPVSVNNSSLSK